MNDKQLQEAFTKFLIEKSGAKNEKELQAYVKQLGEEGMQKVYEEFTQMMQEQTKKKTLKALHGAKLNYLKQLKHKCAEDEELVYFKKGGMIDCGCQKKEQGGTAPKKKTAVEEFKERNKLNGGELLKHLAEVKDMLSKGHKVVKTVGGKTFYSDNESKSSSTAKRIRTLEDDRKNLEKGYNSPEAREQQRKNREKSTKEGVANLDKCGGKLKKKENGGTFQKKGSIKVAACGSKMKKHQEGGSLNGIPFIKKLKNFLQQKRLK